MVVINNIGLMSLIILILAWALEIEVDALMLIQAFGICWCTIATLGALFLPRAFFLLTEGDLNAETLNESITHRNTVVAITVTARNKVTQLPTITT